MNTRVEPAGKAGILDQAADALRRGELVAFPTDTVYGLGADPFNQEAVEKLYAVKERMTSKSIPILLGHRSHLDRVAASLPHEAVRLVEAFWPGPLTIITQRHPGLPPDLSGMHTVGIRMPDHSLAMELLRKTGPLAVTSANRSGELAPSSVEAVLKELAGRIGWIVDGGLTPGGIASTVVDLTEGKVVILREGPISESMLLQAL